MTFSAIHRKEVSIVFLADISSVKGQCLKADETGLTLDTSDGYLMIPLSAIAYIRLLP